MSSEREIELARLAEAVADGREVDWDSATSSSAEERALIADLRAVATVAGIHREAAPAAPAEVSWGPLRLLERSGRGGSCEVDRAFDPALQREVALKLWFDDAASPALARARVLAEARRLARVRHPNVVAVHGAATHAGRAGVWMELLRGRTLEAWAGERGALAPGDAAAIGVSLCRALAALHDAGLAHLDVQARNVFREDDGRIVLLDLGAALEARPGGAAEEPSAGTLHSMAPEQVLGGTVGPAADLYALGALLYWLVSLRHPVEATSLPDLAGRLERAERVPLTEARSGLPAAFTRAVERALATRPSDRFASAADMERALLASCGPDDGASASRWRILLGAAALLALGAALALLLRR